ncbi:MAG: VWA domain-containing protein [Cyanobacteria bacterium J06600_6]
MNVSKACWGQNQKQSHPFKSSFLSCLIYSFGFTAIASAITLHADSVVAQITYDDIPAGGIFFNEASAPCANPLARQFNVTQNVTVSDVNLGFNITHTYRGDIQLRLTHPDGTEITILSPDGGHGTDDYQVLFDDLGTVAASPYNRSAIPNDPLATFNGKNSQGIWTLELCDNFNADSGTYLSSSLILNDLVVNELPNPDYNQSCTVSTKIALVVDGSGSINDNGGVQDVRDGMTDFLEQIVVNAPGTEVGIVEFATLAKTAIPFTAVDINSFNNTFTPYITSQYHEDSGTLGNLTNWEDAFRQTNNTLSQANAVIFITDGVPNRYLDDRDNIRNNKSTEANIREVVPWANAIKQRGTHIYGFGISNGVNSDNFRPITENSGSFEVFSSASSNADTADYSFVQSFNDFGSELTFFTQSLCNTPGAPNIVLVKRITDLSPNRNNVDFDVVVNDGIPNSHDDDPKWQNDFLKGQIDLSSVLPNDEIEYTIYFLSNGNSDVENLSICDLIPENTTFIADSYGANQGISLFLNDVTENQSNFLSDDSGEFHAPEVPVTSPPSSCQEADPNNPNSFIPIDSNTNGAAVINFEDSLPFALGAGNPAGSYGFIRFRVQID